MRRSKLWGIFEKIRSLFSKIRIVLLFSYFIIIFICIASVGAISFYISYRSVSEQVESSSFQIVRQIEKNMDNDFQNKRNLLLAPYFSQEYIDGINAYATMDKQDQFLFRQKIGNLFQKSFNITPIRDFIRVQIYYNNGEMLNASDNQKPWTADEVQQSDWFQQTVINDGRVHFTGPSKGAVSGSDEAAYSSSILIRDFANPDNFIVVRAEYNVELFLHIGQNDSLSANSKLLILDQNNQQVYASFKQSDAVLRKDMLSRITKGSGKFWYGGEQDNLLVTYTESDYSNWKVVLAMPKNEIFGSLDRIKTATLLTTLIAFLVTIIISFLFGQRITNPILDLYRTINRVKRGDFSVRVQVKRSDEIGRIAKNFNDMQVELQNLIESKYIYQIKLQQVELAMLYSQINPHFLYNTLDSIKAMADYYNVEKIGDMAQSLADMFRYNIKNKDEMVTLREELEQIDSYMNIQGIRFEDKITYIQEIDDNLLDYPLLKMTLQPLVENAVFHGVEPKIGKSMIRIIAHKEGESLLITVSDDGVGISAERLKALRNELRKQRLSEDMPVSSAAGGGIGIRNVYARYAIRLGKQFECKIESEVGEGTRVTLIISSWNM
jgi:two-component system sensor histidine kinase YesM